MDLTTETHYHTHHNCADPIKALTSQPCDKKLIYNYKTTYMGSQIILISHFTVFRRVKRKRKRYLFSSRT